MRLINADKLADNMTALLERNRSLVDEWLAVRIVDEITETQPLDAVQVVRCKDCKHYDGSYSYPMCWRHDEEVEPDDYCSFGEKREVKE